MNGMTPLIAGIVLLLIGVYSVTTYQNLMPLTTHYVTVYNSPLGKVGQFLSRLGIGNMEEQQVQLVQASYLLQIAYVVGFVCICLGIVLLVAGLISMTKGASREIELE
jgi:hypothetical protein